MGRIYGNTISQHFGTSCLCLAIQVMKSSHPENNFVYSVTCHIKQVDFFISQAMPMCSSVMQNSQTFLKSKTSNLVGVFLFGFVYLIKEHFRIPVTGKKNEGITFLTPGK